VKQADTAARRISETTMSLLAQRAPTSPSPELPLEVEGAGSELDCTRFGSNVPDEELRPSASFAKPIARDTVRKTLYTFFRKVSSIIQKSLPPVRTPQSSIAPAHIPEETVPTFMFEGLVPQSVLPKGIDTVTLVLQARK
jgi:hypothetical protein